MRVFSMFSRHQAPCIHWQTLMLSTVAQDYMYLFSSLRSKWMVRQINWSQMCEWFQSWWESYFLLSVLQPLAHSCIYIFVFFCETVFCPVLITPLSHTDSLKWLIGCSGLCFFHHFIYLFWSTFQFAPVYGNTISFFSVEKFIRHMSPCYCSRS